MVCFEGSGALSQVSLCNHPDLKNEPLVFAALALKGSPTLARVLEGPIPGWKLYPGGDGVTGLSPYGGLPRFKEATFQARFPFANLTLGDPQCSLDVQVAAWSPFEPGDADNSSLPVAALEYTFVNRNAEVREGVFSFHVGNFLAALAQGGLFVHSHQDSRIIPTRGGFILERGADPQKPWEHGAFAVWTDDPVAKINHSWYRGGWIDSFIMAWRDVERGRCFEQPPADDGITPRGGSLFVPFSLAAGGSKTIRLQLAWYFPQSNLRTAGGENDALLNDGGETYRPWYSRRFDGIESIIRYWSHEYGPLKANAERFRDCFWNSTLPLEILDAVATNLCTLKSTTILRQKDGRLWGWEGSGNESGSFPGSCTHVWNYAQAIAHLFPALERTLRETEFNVNQNTEGHQVFRTAIPIRPTTDPKARFVACADGQLGGILKVHRDWRIGGDTDWLRGLWPKVRQSLDYCIRTWDPRGRGWLEEPQHTTYDNSFWGPNGMCTSIYLGALKAALDMAGALGDDNVEDYAQLYRRGKMRMEKDLFNGEYFYQHVEWRDLTARYPQDTEFSRFGDPGGLAVFYDTPEARHRAEQEGPAYQYGTGCLSDGAIGAWMAYVCGLGDILDPAKITSHLRAVYRYNLKDDLSDNTNFFRSSFACGREGGLLLCTWPLGSPPSLPLLYAGEVWCGIEYQAAAHMIGMGLVEEGLDVVRRSLQRYNGTLRNPFDSMEAGHFYARGMSSYALLQAYSGARYDAVEKVLYLHPAVGGDFRCFLSTAEGYGIVGVKEGAPFVEVVAGRIPYVRIDYRAGGRGL